MTEPVNILIVDDNTNNLLSLQATLDRPDYDLVLARSGQEAVAEVQRSEFALILLDVAMPDMDGFETARRIKEREESKRIPIIFVTAAVYDVDHVFRGYDVGAVDYLQKPLDPHQVRAKVAVFVELFRQRKQIEAQATRLREVELLEQRLRRERAEQALQESEALYQHTFEQAPIGIGHAGPDGVWARANRRLCEILGRSRENLVGRSIAELAEPPNALLGALDRLRRLEIELYTGEHELAASRGTRRWGHVTIRALYRQDREVRHFILVVDDISARRHLEADRARFVEELQEGISARDDFLSIAAHELRTPLTPLRLQVENLLLGWTRQTGAGRSSDPILRKLQALERSVGRLENLTDRLLDLSRLNIGKLLLEPEELDLAELVREVVSRFSAEAAAEGSAIAVTAGEPVIGRWDRMRVDQIVTNFVSNAIKYGEGKPIGVEVSLDRDVAKLAVTDHGIGIPEEAQARIFERFERLGSIHHHGGFGLGLWIARQLAEAHGGRIRVESHPGRGSRFIIELPRVPRTRAAGLPVERRHSTPRT